MSSLSNINSMNEVFSAFSSLSSNLPCPTATPPEASSEDEMVFTMMKTVLNMVNIFGNYQQKKAEAAKQPKPNSIRILTPCLPTEWFQILKMFEDYKKRNSRRIDESSESESNYDEQDLHEQDQDADEQDEQYSGSDVDEEPARDESSTLLGSTSSVANSTPTVERKVSTPSSATENKKQPSTNATKPPTITPSPIKYSNQANQNHS